MVRLRPSAISFTQQQQPPVSGRICWVIAVPSCCHSTADCKAPKKLFDTPWPWPLPVPTSPTRAAACLPVKWLGSIAAISYVQAVTAADIWTSYNNWWRPAHEINGTRGTNFTARGPVGERYPDARVPAGSPNPWFFKYSNNRWEY